MSAIAFQITGVSIEFDIEVRPLVKIDFIAVLPANVNRNLFCTIAIQLSESTDTFQFNWQSVVY